MTRSTFRYQYSPILPLSRAPRPQRRWDETGSEKPQSLGVWEYHDPRESLVARSAHAHRHRRTGPQHNDEDHIPFGSFIAVAVTCGFNGGSHPHQQHRHATADHHSTAAIRNRGPGNHSSALERGLHDRPWPKRVRPARVVLWQQRRTREIQKFVLTTAVRTVLVFTL
jgi:hypothetical protein